MSIIAHIESVLFVASSPISIKKIAQALKISSVEVQEALRILESKYRGADSGVHLLSSGDSIQLTTNSMCQKTVEMFVKSEIMGELTRAQLETLTVIAYRGPITRPELEQIRGVNCAIIVRNLMVRGLIEEKDDAIALMPTYEISIDALRHLGITKPQDLPEYDTLSKHEHIERALNDI